MTLFGDLFSKRSEAPRRRVEPPPPPRPATEPARDPQGAGPRPGPRTPGDRSHTGKLNQPEQPEKRVSIDDVDLSEVKIEGQPEEEGGFLSGLKGLVQGAGELVSQGADLVGDVAGAVVAGSVEVAALGAQLVGEGEAAQAIRQAGAQAGNATNAWVDGLGKDMSEGAVSMVNGALDVAGLISEHGIEGAAKAVADGMWGPPIPGQEGQFSGVLGEVTSRLEPGQGTYLQLGGSLGVGAVLGVEGSLDGAVQLTHGEDGAYYVSMTVQAEVEGTASVDSGAEVGAMGSTAGAMAEAGAALKAGGAVKITMRFDPNNPADKARMEGLLRPAGPSAMALLNPLAMAAPSPEALQAAMANNFHSQELAAQIEGRLSASAKAEGAVPGVEVSAEVGADATAGATRVSSRFADGSRETTVLLQAEAGLNGGLALTGTAGYEQGGRVGGVSAFSTRTGPDGQLQALRMESSKAPEGFQDGGIEERTERLRAGDEGASLDLSLRSRTVTTYLTELTPRGMEAARGLMAQGKSAREAFQAIARQPGMSTTTPRDTLVRSATLGGNAEVKIAGVGGRVRLEAGLGTVNTNGHGSPSLVADYMRRMMEG